MVTVSGASGVEPQERQSWCPAGHKGGGPEGVVERGIKGDETSDTSVAAVSKTHLEDH